MSMQPHGLYKEMQGKSNLQFKIITCNYNYYAHKLATYTYAQVGIISVGVYKGKQQATCLPKAHV